MSAGRIDALTGFVKFRVCYQALAFRPIKGQVVDAEVKSVNQMGFFVKAGPVEIYVAEVVSASGVPWWPGAEAKRGKWPETASRRAKLRRQPRRAEATMRPAAGACRSFDARSLARSEPFGVRQR